MDECILIEWTCDDRKVAADILSDLLESRCIACGTISSQATSQYIWKGKIEEAKEYVIVMKTKKEYYDVIESYIVENHPYELPQVLAISINRGYRPYLDWIEQETS